MKKTDYQVYIQGEIIDVMQAESGRLYATLQVDEDTSRTWHAMTIEKLQQRIIDNP